MNTQRTIRPLSGLVLLTAAGSFAQEVKTDYDRETDFGHYRTYSWEKVQENCPFPIPIVSKNGAWRFDAEAGRREVRFRRIGENELTVISACREFGGGSTGKAPAENAVVFHGYYLRMLAPGQTKAGSGPAMIAYPAEYRSSGVMTFVIAPNGVVYEKDLGPNTAAVAGAMASFHKDASWHVADE